MRSGPEILNKFREDLTAAGFEPLEYFNVANMGLVKWGVCPYCKQSCFFCPSCGKSFHGVNLRKADDGTWSCLRCLGREGEMVLIDD